MFLRLHRRPIYIYFSDDDSEGKRITAREKIKRFGEILVVFCSSNSMKIVHFHLENLLNSSKLVTVPPPSSSSQVEQTEFIENERHERTGSVKFADQAEETKEVKKTNERTILFVTFSFLFSL